MERSSSPASEKTNSVLGNESPLQFQYRQVVNDPHLKNRWESISREIGPKDSTVFARTQRQLAIGTFRALRRDGIVHLLDERSDTYLLISRDRVLVPYLRSVMKESQQASTNDIEGMPDIWTMPTAAERSRRRQHKPPYLTNVPKARLDVVRRSLLKEESLS